jgi:predicted RNA-binding Zn ribbon-like protein
MTENKRKGRPLKPAATGTRPGLGLRVSALTKAAIEARALITGRTQSQEAEWLIETALASEFARVSVDRASMIETQSRAAAAWPVAPDRRSALIAALDALLAVSEPGLTDVQRAERIEVCRNAHALADGLLGPDQK